MMLKQDTTRAGRQWYADATPGYWFSTPDDATEAFRFAANESKAADRAALATIRDILLEMADPDVPHQNDAVIGWALDLLDLMPGAWDLVFERRWCGYARAVEFCIEAQSDRGRVWVKEHLPDEFLEEADCAFTETRAEFDRLSSEADQDGLMVRVKEG